MGWPPGQQGRRAHRFMPPRAAGGVSSCPSCIPAARRFMPRALYSQPGNGHQVASSAGTGQRACQRYQAFDHDIFQGTNLHTGRSRCPPRAPRRACKGSHGWLWHRYAPWGWGRRAHSTPERTRGSLWPASCADTPPRCAAAARDAEEPLISFPLAHACDTLATQRSAGASAAQHAQRTSACTA